MAARSIKLNDKNWFLESRPPAGRKDHLEIATSVTPEAIKQLKSMMTLQQIADAMQFSTWTVREWCKEWERSQGKKGLKGQKVRGQWRVYKEDLLRFLYPNEFVIKG